MTMAKATPSIQQEPYFAEGTEAMIALEAMVDHAGLRNVVWAMAHICWAKAEHVQAAWQDDQLARDWNANAAMLNRFAEKLRSVLSGEQFEAGSHNASNCSHHHDHQRTIAMAALSLSELNALRQSAVVGSWRSSVTRMRAGEATDTKNRKRRIKAPTRCTLKREGQPS